MSHLEYFRVFAMVLVGLALASFPAAVARQGRPASAWVAVAAAEIMLFAELGQISAHLHDPKIHWYQAPSGILSASLFLAFAYITFKEKMPQGKLGEYHESD